MIDQMQNVIDEIEEQRHTKLKAWDNKSCCSRLLTF